MSRKTLFIISLLIGCISLGIASEIIVPRLSPVSDATLKGRKLSLNGTWSFSPAPGKHFPEKRGEGGWRPIQVPGEWVMQGFEVAKGEAAAFDRNLPLSGLAGPAKEPSNHWSFDQTANGSNIFRSTKANIYQAALSGGEGERVTVVSDGTQHFRAWMDTDAVRFLVADYNNAGSDNFLVSHAEKGYRPLRKGDRIQGTVRLQWK